MAEEKELLGMIICVDPDAEDGAGELKVKCGGTTINPPGAIRPDQLPRTFNCNGLRIRINGGDFRKGGNVNYDVLNSVGSVITSESVRLESDSRPLCRDIPDN